MKKGFQCSVLRGQSLRFTFSSIAQSVEHAAVNRSVVGSSPTGGGIRRTGKDGKRLRGQAVKTSPFHGGNTGSIPVGVIRKICKYGAVAKW